MNAEQQFVEEFGLFFEQLGLARTVGRILAWLLICDPPHQTQPEIAAALQASKSTISTATRTLLQMGFIERVSLPGHRRDYFRVKDGVWEELAATGNVTTARFKSLAKEGLAVLGAEASPARRQVLEELYDLYDFAEEEMAQLFERWQQKKASL